ncbi:hypothetical protein BDD12DRAFT_808912 [Trichophaea hybrida]|nr:hypothetical protein BDD12DRAFT_808912 [Trichophaea hybrida]
MAMATYLIDIESGLLAQGFLKFTADHDPRSDGSEDLSIQRRLSSGLFVSNYNNECTLEAVVNSTGSGSSLHPQLDLSQLAYILQKMTPGYTELLSSRAPAVNGVQTAFPSPPLFTCSLLYQPAGLLVGDAIAGTTKLTRAHNHYVFALNGVHLKSASKPCSEGPKPWKARDIRHKRGCYDLRTKIWRSRLEISLFEGVVWFDIEIMQSFEHVGSYAGLIWLVRKNASPCISVYTRRELLTALL